MYLFIGTQFKCIYLFIYLFKGIYLVTAAAAVCLHFFYTRSATRVLNSFEELWITLAAADNSFARVLNPHGGAYIYIYIYIYIVELIMSISHCVWTLQTPKSQDMESYIIVRKTSI